MWLFYLEISNEIFKDSQKLSTFISVPTNLDINVKVSNVYLNVKIRSLIHLTTHTYNSLSLRNFNYIFEHVKPHTYTILYKVISFEKYTRTHCGLFNHTVQHPYCGLFGHTIQHHDTIHGPANL